MLRHKFHALNPVDGIIPIQSFRRMVKENVAQITEKDLDMLLKDYIKSGGLNYNDFENLFQNVASVVVEEVITFSKRKVRF